MIEDEMKTLPILEAIPMTTNRLSRGRYMRQAWRYDIKRRRRDREPGILTGVRNIARYMQIGAETFYKLYQHHGLPAMRLPGGRWSTSKNLIDDWIVARWKAQTGKTPDEAETSSATDN